MSGESHLVGIIVNMPPVMNNFNRPSMISSNQRSYIDRLLADIVGSSLNPRVHSVQLLAMPPPRSVRLYSLSMALFHRKKRPALQLFHKPASLYSPSSSSSNELHSTSVTLLLPKAAYLTMLFTAYDAEEMKFGSIDGREDGEYNGAGFVEIPKTRAGVSNTNPKDAHACGHSNFLSAFTVYTTQLVEKRRHLTD